MKQKMMNSRFGKLLRRLIGEDAGAVMMEYVIVAVLVAAAAVVAIAYFGRTVVTETNIATTAISEGGTRAAQKQQDQKGAYETGTQEAVDANKKFTDTQTEAKK